MQSPDFRLVAAPDPRGDWTLLAWRRFLRLVTLRDERLHACLTARHTIFVRRVEFLTAAFADAFFPDDYFGRTTAANAHMRHALRIPLSF